MLINMGNKNNRHNMFNRGNQQQQPNNQPKVEQKQENAPLANVANSTPAVEYCTEAELASLCLLLDRLEESAQTFGDLAVETVSAVITDIRSNIVTTGSLSEADAAEIKKLEEEIALLEDEAGCNSPFSHISEGAFKALEEGTDEICVKWKSAQELIREFGGEETQQMSVASYKSAIQQLAFQQVWAFVIYPIDVTDCPEAIVNIDTDFNALLEREEEPQSEVQPAPAIAVV